MLIQEKKLFVYFEGDLLNVFNAYASTLEELQVTRNTQITHTLVFFI